MENKVTQFDMPKTGNSHAREEHKRVRMVECDVALIEKALASNDERYMKDIHTEIDGKYQACISQWGNGMQAHHLEHGFVYDYLNEEYLKHNLKLMKAKLESYSIGLNIAIPNGESKDVSVVVNNNISIDISFQNAREKIEDMAGLTQKETEEILEKINELEAISKKSISRKKKWEEIHPILSFVMDKSVDVAIMVFSLFLQMNI